LQRYREARASRDARWDALIATERAHRSADATVAPPDEPTSTCHVAAAQNH
jgi:anaerobic magnesium-protoporphyrin IX monomethyl ester cyclase